MTNDLILNVKHLCKSYGSQAVISSLSLGIRRGERVALAAPSGAGKTTLLRILCGLETPDSGSVELCAAQSATIFQEARLFPFLTVLENILLPFRAQGKPVTPEVRRRCQEWLEVCGLTPFQKHFPGQISGGMKQKTALVRGLLGMPDFLMMDEPFQSIEPASTQAIVRHMLQDNPHLSLLFITHNREEVPLLAQHVLYFPQPCLRQPVQIPAESFGQGLIPQSPALRFRQPPRGLPAENPLAAAFDYR